MIGAACLAADVHRKGVKKDLDNRIIKLARLLVNYSCKVQPGEKVYIH